MAKRNVPTFEFSFNRSQELGAVERALVVTDAHCVPNLSTATTMVITEKGTLLHQTIAKAMRTDSCNKLPSFGTSFIKLPLMTAFVALTFTDYHVYLKTGKFSAICLTLLYNVDKPGNIEETRVEFKKAHFKAKAWVVPVPLEIALSAGPAGQKSLFDFNNEVPASSLFPLVNTLADKLQRPKKETKDSKKADRLMKKAEKKAEKATTSLTPRRVA